MGTSTSWDVNKWGGVRGGTSPDLHQGRPKLHVGASISGAGVKKSIDYDMMWGGDVNKWGGQQVGGVRGGTSPDLHKGRPALHVGASTSGAGVKKSIDYDMM